MIIYKDIISGDELFSDTYKEIIEDECFFKVCGKTVTRRAGGIDDALIGGNASAEDPQEGGGDDADVQTGCDVVLDNRLQQVQFDKVAFKSYCKDYCKKVLAKLKEAGNEEAAKEFQKAAQSGMKRILGDFKNFEFFAGESTNCDGSHGFLNYEDAPDGSGERPYLLFFKHALIAEKV